MPTLIRSLVHLLCLLPMVWLIYTAYQDGLGANPIEYITRYSGDWTLRILLVTLTVSPLARLTHTPRILKYRRAIGLYTFFYAVCHFVTYIWLDQFFDWNSIVLDIAKRPFILVGFTAFVLLIPLAVTSNDRAVRYLQNSWRTLHKLVYVIAIAGLLHYWWLVRADFLKATVYLIILSILFGYRIIAYVNARRRY